MPPGGVEAAPVAGSGVEIPLIVVIFLRHAGKQQDNVECHVTEKSFVIPANSTILRKNATARGFKVTHLSGLYGIGPINMYTCS